MSTIIRSTAPDLVLERTFQASAEELFDAWTDAEALRRWFKPHPQMEVPHAHVDLRVGGGFRVDMRRPDGQIHSSGGEYVEIDRPRRLVYLEAGRSGGEPSTITVEFAEAEDGCTLTLTHSGLSSQQARDGASGGWGGGLENLAAFLAGRAEPTAG